MISRSDLGRVIAEKTLHETNMEKLTQAIAGYLLEHNQVDDIESLMRDVLKFRADNGYVEATAVSAYPISRELKADLLAELKQDYPHAKNYVLNERVDETVVGGVRLEMASEELDLTVRAKLNKFKRLTTARES